MLHPDSSWKRGPEHTTFGTYTSKSTNNKPANSFVNRSNIKIVSTRKLGQSLGLNSNNVHLFMAYINN